MTDETTQGTRESKRAYRRPELIQISLRPEEAVLGNCKHSGASGPSGGNCGLPLGACAAQGS